MKPAGPLQTTGVIRHWDPDSTEFTLDAVDDPYGSVEQPRALTLPAASVHDSGLLQSVIAQGDS